jgi:protein-tyrosine phosphatase
MEKINVVFVCMGNICRSPSAEGVFRELVERHDLTAHIEIDSAGTHAYHVGEPPDGRAQAAAGRRGIDLSRQVARRFAPTDFNRFDYVVAMDQENLARLQELCPPDYPGRLSLLLKYAPELGVEEVPDPYYGGANGFERVLDLIEQAAEGLLADIRQRHKL